MTVQSTDLLNALNTAADPIQTTQVLQQAIDAAGDAGGVVSVPPGRWVTTTLYLRSRMTLRLERGATLAAHTDLDDYPKHNMGHNKDRTGYHYIVALDCDELTIEGDGEIDGQGPAFWEPPIRDLKAQGKDVSDDIARAPKRWPIDGPFWRGWGPRISPLMELRGCRNLVLRDFTIRNSPGWTVHPCDCEQVRIDGITIENDMFGPNTDGIDINGCRDVLVTNCRVVGCDDNIILKATEDVGPCERIAVTNCTFKTNCAALGIGAERASGIRDITFSNCVVEQAIRIVQLQVWTLGCIERVAISNISGAAMVPDEIPQEKVVYMDVYRHHRYPDGPLGYIRQVTVSGVTARTKGRCVVSSEEPGHISDITLRDIDMVYEGYEDNPTALPRNHSTQNSNGTPWVQQTNAAVIAQNVDRIWIENVRAALPEPGENVPSVHGLALRGVRGGVIDCPWLKANASDAQDVLAEDCSDLIQR